MKFIGAILLSLSIAGCCNDLNCEYAYMTTERVQDFCMERGGVQSVQWNDHTAICKDGTLQAFKTGYYHKEDGPPTP